MALGCAFITSAEATKANGDALFAKKKDNMLQLCRHCHGEKDTKQIRWDFCAFCMATLCKKCMIKGCCLYSPAIGGSSYDYKADPLALFSAIGIFREEHQIVNFFNCKVLETNENDLGRVRCIESLMINDDGSGQIIFTDTGIKWLVIFTLDEGIELDIKQIPEEDW